MRFLRSIALAFTHIEPLVRVLSQDARRKRPEALPELDLDVHRRLHLCRPGVAQDAARTERPRTEFHTAVEPPDNFFADERLGDFVEQRVFARMMAVARAGALQEGFDLA